MNLNIRKKSITIESHYAENGPAVATPLKLAVAYAVVKNPFAGVYQENLLDFMKELRSVGLELATDLIEVLGKDSIEVYGKATIVGVNGEYEHGAVWHEAGGWAMREVLGNPKAIVPASQVTAAAGFRLIMPLHYIHACYVRSHFNSIEVGTVDAPRPNEILFALGMGTGGRIHARVGGLALADVSVHDGQR